MFTKEESIIEKRYQEGLDKQKTDSQSEIAKENIVDFYNDNKDICEKALNYYQEYMHNQNEYVCVPKRISKKEFLKLTHSKRLLVVTANPIEKGVFLRWLSEKNGTPLETYIVNNNAYNVYHETSGISVVHIFSGETGEEFAKRAIDDTCKIFIPDCICSLGICYGFNIKRHKIGTVFLSEKTELLRINFRDSTRTDDMVLDIKSILSGNSSYAFIKALKSKLNFKSSFSILSDINSPSIAVHEFGDFLSANSLISNWKVKNSILKLSGLNQHKLLGGEMEGGGILTSNIVQNSDYNKWIIIKGVSDWGEFKNDIIPDQPSESERIKDSLQAYAMSNSCGVFNNIIHDMCEV